jgi:ribosomal protein RSM22 (predicted rRNA methylase)
MASQIGTAADVLHLKAGRSTLQRAGPKEDWCHFSERLERTSLHRKLKSAELGYEDEKFSYIAAARQNVARAAVRVIRHPVQLRGHIKLELCALHGLRQETITRKQGEEFKRARKTKWGDGWE